MVGVHVLHRQRWEDNLVPEALNAMARSVRGIRLGPSEACPNEGMR